MEYVRQFDFGIVGYIPPLDVIEGHRKSPYFTVRFGLALPPRPASPPPPSEVAEHESRYVAQLYGAYGDHLHKKIVHHSTLEARLQSHFERARRTFYCAEALRNFSRDTLPDGAFEHLQQQIYDGVVDVCEDEHADGLARLNATTRQAANLAVTSSALIGRTDIADRYGVCHQLANEDRLNWVPNGD